MPVADPIAAIQCLTDARTANEAREKFTALTGRPSDAPWQESAAALVAALSASAWTIWLCSPMHRVLQEWLSVRRIEEDLEALRTTAALIEQELASPTIWRVVEVSKEDGPTRIGPEGQLVEIVTRGPDILSVRAGAATKARGEAIRGEAELRRAHASLARAVEDYRASLLDWETMTEQRRLREIWSLVIKERQVPAAIALYQTSKTPPENGGSDALRARLAARLKKC